MAAQASRGLVANMLDDASGHLGLADLALEVPDLAQARNQIDAARASIAGSSFSARRTVQQERAARESLSQAIEYVGYVIGELDRLRRRD